MEIIERKIKNNIYDTMDHSFLSGEINPEFYNTKFISIFDHWLNEKEAEDNIIIFQDIEEYMVSEKYKKYTQFENRFKKFYETLYQDTSVYIELYGRIFKFSNMEEYMSFVSLNIKEQLFTRFIIPEFYIIVEGGYDLTHLIYIHRKSKAEQYIKNLVNNCELFILV